MRSGELVELVPHQGSACVGQTMAAEASHLILQRSVLCGCKQLLVHPEKKLFMEDLCLCMMWLLGSYEL